MSRNFGRALFCFLLAPIFASAQSSLPAVPEPKAPEGVTHLADVVYCKLPGGRALQLDIACPTRKTETLPAIVFLHGTGELSRGRKYNLPQCFELAQKGFVAVAVSFRHLPSEPFPHAIHDVKCSIRWLRANADRFKIDPKRIGVVGYSGGGSLALLLALTPTVKEFEGVGGCPDQSSAVQAAVAYFAPTDLVDLVNHEPDGFAAKLKAAYVQGSLHTWLGGSPKEVPERYRMASPVTHVRRGAPPILLLHGEHDDVVPVKQSLNFATKLRAFTKDVEFVILNAPHDFDAMDTVVARIAKVSCHVFLETHLVTKTVTVRK